VHLSLGASLYVCCSAGTAQQCFPLRDRQCPYVCLSLLKVAYVLMCEVTQNVGYTTKHSENSLVFTALDVN